MSEPVHLIGIDPGVKTGYARAVKGELQDIGDGDQQQIKQYVLYWNQKKPVKVIVEDARLRKWYGNNSYGKAQGAGSVKRDCQMWESFLQKHDIDYEMIHPIKGGTKLKAKAFRNITGWKGRTNEHKRDAAMIVFKRIK